MTEATPKVYDVVKSTRSVVQTTSNITGIGNAEKETGR